MPSMFWGIQWSAEKESAWLGSFNPFGSTSAAGGGGTGGVVAGPSYNLQAETYGSVIPISGGNRRLPGRYIWAKVRRDLTKTATTSATGATVLSDSEYLLNPFADVAVSFGYRGDLGAATSLAKLYLDGVQAKLTGPGALSFTFYNGTQTTANATIVADKGAANTPAFRDQIYIVIRNLDLSKFGNRFPAISATLEDTFAGGDPEILKSPTGDSEGSIAGDYAGDRAWAATAASYVSGTSGGFTYNYSTDIQEFETVDTPSVVGSGGLTSAGSIVGFHSASLVYCDWIDALFAFACHDPTGGTPRGQVPAIISTSRAVLAQQTSGLDYTTIALTKDAFVPPFAIGSFASGADAHILYRDSSAAAFNVSYYDASAGTITDQGATSSVLTGANVDHRLVAGAEGDYYVAATDLTTGDFELWRVRFTGAGSWSETLLYSGTWPAAGFYPSTVHYDTTSGNIIVPAADYPDAQLLILDSAGGVVFDGALTGVDPAASFPLNPPSWRITGTLYIHDTSNEKIHAIDAADGSIVSADLTYDADAGTFSSHGSTGYGLANGGGVLARINFGGAPTEVVPLSLAWSIVKRGTQLGQLTDGQIETEGLGELISGFLVWENADFRSHLDNDGALFGFDYFESGAGIKCRKAVDGATYTIDRVLTEGDFVVDDDRAAMIQAGRAGQEETPAIVNCNYIDSTVEYRISKQRARRAGFPVPALNSNRTADFVTSIIMDADDALSAAGRALFRMDAGRLAVSFRLNSRHIDVEPSAILQLPAIAGRVLVVKVRDATIREDLSVELSAQVLLANESIALTGGTGDGLVTTNDPPVVAVRLTEGGDVRLTEAGDLRLLEGAEIG